MERIKMNVIVDSLAFIFLVVSLGSGLVMWLVLPSGGQSTLLEMGRGDWRVIHNISSVVFALLIFTHLVLHSTWIMSIPKIMGWEKTQK